MNISLNCGFLLNHPFCPRLAPSCPSPWDFKSKSMFSTPTGLRLTPVLQFFQVQGHMEHFHFQVGHNASFSQLAKVSFLEGKRSCSHNKRWHHPEVEAWNIKQEMNNHPQLGPGEEYYKVKLVSCLEAVFLWINQGDKGERTTAHLWCWRQC